LVDERQFIEGLHTLDNGGKIYRGLIMIELGNE